MRAAKKFPAIFLAVILIACAVFISGTATGFKATPTSSSVIVSDKNIAFQAYNIDGNNYFKLRDIAMSLSNSPARFSVDYDATNNTIYLLTNKYYVPIGGELNVSGGASSVNAVPTTANIYLNGDKVSLTAFNIGGANYFKLRDIGITLNFGVAYNTQYDYITIDPTKDYYTAAFLEVLPKAVENTVQGTIHSYDTDNGYILISKVSNTSYNITAEQLTDTHDLTLLRNVLGVVITTPDVIMDALTAAKDSGTKSMTLNNRTITFYYTGNTRSVDITWS